MLQILIKFNAYLDNSPVLAARLHSRWNGHNLNEIVVDGLSDEGLEAVVEYFQFSHVKRAFENFTIATELLIFANQYLISHLEEILLDLLCAKPKEWFADIGCLIEIYLFLDVTRISVEALKKVSRVLRG